MAKKPIRWKRVRYIRLISLLTLLYFVGSIGYYFLPWEMRQPVYNVSPGLNNTLRKQGFRLVEAWDRLGWWGRDCRTALGGEGGEHVYGGKPSQDFKLFNRVKVLENEGYLTGYSEEMKNPLWVAYRVFDVPSLESGRRPSRFRVDHRTEAKVSPDDYRGTGYDRGHMAPNFAMATRYGIDGQWESFLMSNVIPQSSQVNRYMWKDLEMLVARRYGRYFGEVWVITGPVFMEPVRRFGSGIAIPSGYYKILLDEDGDEIRVLAFMIESRCPPFTRLRTRLVSVDDIEALTGMDFFPDLPKEAQTDLESEPASRLWPWLGAAVKYVF